jgi:hypothetical protein
MELEDGVEVVLGVVRDRRHRLEWLGGHQGHLGG